MILITEPGTKDLLGQRGLMEWLRCLRPKRTTNSDHCWSCTVVCIVDFLKCNNGSKNNKEMSIIAEERLRRHAIQWTSDQGWKNRAVNFHVWYMSYSLCLINTKLTLLTTRLSNRWRGVPICLASDFLRLAVQSHRDQLAREKVHFAGTKIIDCESPIVRIKHPRLFFHFLSRLNKLSFKRDSNIPCGPRENDPWH